MLAFKSMQGGALFESFLLSPFPILKNIQITNISKPVQKVVPNIFEINLKINKMKIKEVGKRINSFGVLF